MLATFTVTNTANDGAGSLRVAIFESNEVNGKDEIIFDASLFASGTPVINSTVPITVTEPVKIHSPHGPVIIQKASSAQEALFLRPNLSQGIGEDFEIRDLVFANFKYGIRVLDTGGTADATVEGVKIIGNGFLHNERGIYFERAPFPFEIAENLIIGRGAGANPNHTDAGIWIENPTTTNTFTAEIRDNAAIGDHDGFGIFVLGAKITNLSITGNGIGKDETGAAAPNNAGITIQGAEMSNGVIADNEIVNNGSGLSILFTDDVEIHSNTFQSNASNGIGLGSVANDHRIYNNEFINNGGAGIAIGGGLSDMSHRNRVSDNYFAGNGGPAIDLGSNGLIEANDTNDSDDGPNRKMNHPVILSSQIVDEGTQWRVPVQFDGFTPGTFRFEFYRHTPVPGFPARGQYEFIRAEVRSSSPAGDWSETLYFQHGTELDPGDHLAVLAIWETTTGGTPVGDTSELVSTSGPLPNAAPRITEVILSGSNSIHDPYFFSGVDGSGEQLRTVPVGGIDTLEVQFSEAVTVSQTDLRFVGMTRLTMADTVFEPEILSFDEPDAGNNLTAKWQFTAPITHTDYYLLSLAETIRDLYDNVLDGDWVNPLTLTTTNSMVSEFPSGDGIAGGAFNFVLTILPGDAAGSSVGDGLPNLIVDLTDYDTVLGNVDVGVLFVHGNFDGSGTTSLDDLNTMQGHLGINLNLLGLFLLADLNGDGAVDVVDEFILYDNIGMANPTREDGDLDGDNDVDSHDLNILGAMWYLAFVGVS